VYPLDDCEPGEEDKQAEATVNEGGSDGHRETVTVEATPIVENEDPSEGKRREEDDDDDEKQYSPSSHGATTLVDETPYEPKAGLPDLLDLRVYAPPGEQREIFRREGWIVS
jgi:hypothetical protein